MKRIAFFLILLLSTVTVFAQTKKKMAKKPAAPAAATAPAAKPAAAEKTTWSLDNSHSNVKFTVKHLMISEMEGYFKTFDGKVAAMGNDFSNATVDFSVDVNSINTDNADRDKHLKADDFFNAEKYPKMMFKSTAFKKINEKKYSLEGNLTIRDVTKKVKFDVDYLGTTKDPWGNTKAGFKASGSINRLEYGLKWNTLTEAGGAVVGSDVKININLELKKDASK